MSIQRRRKPDTERSIRLFSFAAVVCLSLGVCFIFLVTRSETYPGLLISCSAPILTFFGVALIPGILWQIFWPGSRRNRFLRSSDRKQGRIIDRHKERLRVSLKDLPGDELGCTLGLIAVILSRVIPIYMHELVLEFGAIRPDTTVEKVSLRAVVSARIFDRYYPGSAVEVKYLPEDPCIAILEGERS